MQVISLFHIWAAYRKSLHTFQCVSVNSYKWLRTEQDAFCCRHVSQYHRVLSLYLSAHPAGCCQNINAPTTHIDTHRPTRTHIARWITVIGVRTSWLTRQSAYMHQQFPFTWGQMRREWRKGKYCEVWWREQLFIDLKHLWWEEIEEKKNLLNYLYGCWGFWDWNLSIYYVYDFPPVGICGRSPSCFEVLIQLSKE